MAELLRHRQTKEAATDMFILQPPRHIPTLPKTRLRPKAARRFTSNIRHRPQNRIGGSGDDKLADNDARK